MFVILALLLSFNKQLIKFHVVNQSSSSLPFITKFNLFVNAETATIIHADDNHTAEY